MYYVIQTGAKQYIVQKGDKISIEKLDLDIDNKVKFDIIASFDDKGAIKYGTPIIEGEKLEAKVLDQYRDKKVRVFKMKRRKRYRKNYGHRQSLTEVEIGDVKKA